MKFVLEAKPQGAVEDADNSVNLNASDAVNTEVWEWEAGKEEVARGIKPVADMAEKKSTSSL